MRIPTTQQIRELESNWIAACAEHWGQVLMEVAGRGAAIRALRLWQESPGQVVVMCGRGNNGGDGLVVARYLSLWGVPVSVWIVTKTGGAPASKAAAAKAVSNTAAGGDTDAVRSGSLYSRNRASDHASEESECDESSGVMASRESNINKEILATLEVPVRVLDVQVLTVPDGDEAEHAGSDPDVDRLFAGTSLIVDALFGTGLDRQVDGVHARVIDAINRSGKRVLSIDIPSGVNSDTGQVMGTAIRADMTVTFGYLKPGHLTHPGATLSGALAIVDIGLPELRESTPDINLATVEVIREILPLRPENSHKGSFGSVLAIAGSVGMAGAAMLAAVSALKIGAGLCQLATPKSVLGYLPSQEVIYFPMAETEDGTFSQEALPELRKKIQKAGTVILGPGLTMNKDTVQVVLDLVQDIDVPCIIDADGLNALAISPESLPKDAGHFVLTPHPKELSRLLGCDTEEIQSDRVAAALKAAHKFNCTILLKGAMSVIASPHGEVFINPTGNPGIATAGSGDVLSGIIGGLLAQRVEPFQAAVAGAYIHGRAGDLLADDLGECGLLAGDLQRILPLALQSIKEGERSKLESTLLSDGTD